MRTARFRVWTEGDPEDARGLVRDLERFHQVMLAKTSAEEHVGAPPLQILLARDVRSLKALTGLDYAGLFNTSVWGNFAFVVMREEAPKAGESTSRDVLFHEYTHYIMAGAGSRAPSWYQEGFAEYMASTTFTETGAYTLGCPPQYRTRWAEYLDWVPIGRVMEAESMVAIGRHRSVDAYAQAWYAVHYFNQDPQRRQQLAKYLELWAAGTRSEQAAKQAFGVDYGELDDMLRAYSARESFECVEIQPAQALEVTEAEIRPLSKAEAHYRIGTVLVAGGMSLGQAREVLEQALAIEPGYADALGALARVHLLQAEALANEEGDPVADLSQAQMYLKRAHELAPDSPERLSIGGHIHFFKARLAAAKGDEASARSELAEARRAFRKAIHADETLAEAFLGLGRTYLLEDDGAEEAQVVLEAAAYLVPREPVIALMLGQLHIQRKQHAQAIAPLEHVLLWGQPEARAEGTKLIAQARKAAGVN